MTWRGDNNNNNSIYCKSTICFRRHKNIMVYLLNFNITYIIILATCFDYYESSSGLIFKNYLHIVLQFLFCLTDRQLTKTKTKILRQRNCKKI